MVLLTVPGRQREDERHRHQEHDVDARHDELAIVRVFRRAPCDHLVFVHDRLVARRRQDEPLGREARLDGDEGEGDEEEAEGVRQAAVHRLRVVDRLTLDTPRVQDLHMTVKR